MPTMYTTKKSTWFGLKSNDSNTVYSRWSKVGEKVAEIFRIKCTVESLIYAKEVMINLWNNNAIVTFDVLLL